MIEHWVHLRCAGIRQSQYTDTWTCHIHRESRLTTHTAIAPPHPSRPWSTPLPTPHLHHQHHCNQNTHTSNTLPVPTGLVKPKPNPLIHSPPSPPTPPRAKHMHISHTPPTPLFPSTTLIHNTSAAINTILEPRVPPTCPALTTPALPSTSHHHTLSADTHTTQTTVHASQSQQPSHPHRLPRQPHRHTKDDHMTTDTTQGHRPSSKSERNLIILLIHDRHADITTIQETKLTPEANTPKVHNLTTVRADRLHNAGGGLITLIGDSITFTTTDINTHNTELQMVKVHINNTKHITIANIYIPPRDSTSTYYKTADTDTDITNIPHSVLTGDVNAHSTLWHSYTDGHRGQLIADVISNSDLITLNTNTPTRVPNTTLQQT